MIQWGHGINDDSEAQEDSLNSVLSWGKDLNWLNLLWSNIKKLIACLRICRFANRIKISESKGAPNQGIEYVYFHTL